MKKIIKKARKYGEVLLGIIIVSLSYNIFYVPNNLAAGGVGGMAIIFKAIFNINISLFILVLDLLLIVFSFCALDKKSTIKTILGSILFPVFVYLTGFITKYIDLSSLDMTVKILLAGITSGIGYGMVFKEGYTTGGTDILDAILTKYFKINIGTSILIIDGLIVICGGIVFGIESMLYSILILLLISTYSNKSVIGIGNTKNFYILTSKIKEIKSYLLNEMNTDLTVIKAEGGYTNNKTKLLLCCVSTSDYLLVKENILKIDPTAFLTIVDSYEVGNENRVIKSFKNI